MSDDNFELMMWLTGILSVVWMAFGVWVVWRIVMAVT